MMAAYRTRWFILGAIPIIAYALMGSGCRAYTYIAPDGARVEVVTVLSDTRAGEIDAGVMPDGTKYIRVKELTTEQQLTALVQLLAAKAIGGGT